MMLDPDLTNDWLSFEEFKRRHVKVPVEEYTNEVLEAIERPVVSVVIITYQHVEYIQAAIDAVLMQETEFPFEIIIGDDGSTDGTREICIKYAEKFPDRIRLFLHVRENNIRILGRASGIFQIAYNLYQCRGQYLAITSGDDFWQDKKKLRKQVDCLEENFDCSFSYHDHVRLFPETGKIEGPFSVDRIQTVLGRNVFSKLPEEFLSVMQEDTFLKFFWRQIGTPRYIKSVNPAVIRFHGESMYTSLDAESNYLQRKNLWNKIILACRNEKNIRKNAEKKLIEVIFYNYHNRKTYSFHRKIKKIALELRQNNQLRAGIMHILWLSLGKLTRNRFSKSRVRSA